VTEGRKRWIDSLGTFRIHGFRFEDIRRLPNADVARYPDGEPVTARSHIVLPGERDVLPDIAPLAPSGLRLSTVNGRAVLRFTGSFWNKGLQAFDLRTHQGPVVPGAQEGVEEVYQHVVAADGAPRTKYVGTFVYHPAHNHHHYDNFAEYILEAIRVPEHDRGAIVPSTRQKTTFCFRDDVRRPAGILGTPPRGVFTSCGSTQQGLSVGWIDVYPSTLPDQYIDVQGLPPGIYALSFLLDPHRRFMEKETSNNIGTTFIELDVSRSTFRIIASLSPFPTDDNSAVDGTLTRTTDNGNVYLLQNGTKRWLRSAEIFASYGFDWSAVYPVTHAMMHAIPDQPLIRLAGTDEVHVLNEHGYRRHIRTLEFLDSYGFTLADIAEVSELDFWSYPKGDLILLTGDDQVYQVEDGMRHPLGTLNALQEDGRDLRGLHVVTDADFAAYALAP